MTSTFIRGGKRYFLTFINDASSVTYIFTIRTKDEDFESLLSFMNNM